MCCRLVNKLIPGYVKKINTKGGNFALMENLAAVQKGMREYGLPEDELFQPVDLFEARNIKAVVKSLAALARLVSYSLHLLTLDAVGLQLQLTWKRYHSVKYLSGITNLATPTVVLTQGASKNKDQTEKSYQRHNTRPQKILIEIQLY